MRVLPVEALPDGNGAAAGIDDTREAPDGDPALREVLVRVEIPVVHRITCRVRSAAPLGPGEHRRRRM